ncbi:MAG: hypothetical protein F6K10_35230 [Moorea sp. SIO2B7]|nr:hypothetical protein [Moorena sp. SIO2B7]
MPENPKIGSAESRSNWETVVLTQHLDNLLSCYSNKPNHRRRDFSSL